MNKYMQNFKEQLEKYVALVTRLNVEYRAKMGYSDEVHGSIIVTVDEGSKYAKVSVGSSVHTFIEKSTGNILKAATWRAPAKNGVRGNIYSADIGESVINQFGAKYLK